MLNSHWKQMGATIVTGLLAVSLAACGQASTAQAPQQSQPVPQTQPKSAAAEEKTVEGVLHFYTSQPDTDAAQLVEAFTKKYPQVQVETFRSGTEEVISRLLAEAQAGSTKADVLLVADAATFVNLKNQQLLEPYQSPEAEHIPAELRDPDGTYYGTKAIATALVVNTQHVSQLPTSWQVLTDPANKGKTVMASPLYSGAAAYNLGVFTRDDSFGWEFYQQLKENEATVVKGNGGVLQSVANGEKSYGIIVDFMAARAANEGSPVALVYPEEGVPVITEPIGIVKGSKNLAAAQAFVDFVLSQEGQELAVSIGYTPIRQGVQPPEGMLTIDQLQMLSADPEELEKTREADKQRFGEMMGGN